MSDMLWDLAFYPRHARVVSLMAAGAHIERKWEGLRAVNLREHWLVKRPGMNGIYMMPDNGVVPLASSPYWTSFSLVFRVGGEECAWCHHARRSRSNNDLIYGAPNYFDDCLHCPAVKAGAGRCTDPRQDYYGPYNDWVVTGNTWPIISWIRRARERIEKGDTCPNNKNGS